MDKALAENVADLLTALSNTTEPPPKCECGETMEYQSVTFVFQGHTWPVRLPFCRECHGAELDRRAHTMYPRIFAI
jgi:hypothetical protein